MKTAAGDNPYVGVPCFVSRAFRHTSIYVRTDRVREPKDLKGRKVGVPEYQLTANVWARAILRGRLWRGARGHPLGARRDRARRPYREDRIKLPPGVALENAPDGPDHLGSHRQG